MRTKSVRLAILLACIVAMPSCIHFWNVGAPCMGNGCPTGTGGQAPVAARQTEAQPATQASQAQPADGAAPAGAADASAAQENVAQGTGAQASPAANNTQPAANQQKPGRFTRILEALHLHSKS